MSRLLVRESTVFTPLRRVSLFRQVFVENGTVRWPGGADIDPELLYEQSFPESEESLVEGLTAMPDVGKDEDFSCRKIDTANEWFEMPEETPPSAYPVDTAWENRSIQKR
jgi:hypothetical protein